MFIQSFTESRLLFEGNWMLFVMIATGGCPGRGSGVGRRRPANISNILNMQIIVVPDPE